MWLYKHNTNWRKCINSCYSSNWQTDTHKRIIWTYSNRHHAHIHLHTHTHTFVITAVISYAVQTPPSVVRVMSSSGCSVSMACSVPTPTEWAIPTTPSTSGWERMWWRGGKGVREGVFTTVNSLLTDSRHFRLNAVIQYNDNCFLANGQWAGHNNQCMHGIHYTYRVQSI